jgi:hypothetical protein
MLLETPGFVDQAFEHAAHRGAVERWRRERSETVQDAALAIRIVNLHLPLTFDVSHGKDEPNALRDEVEDPLVHLVDRAAELFEFGDRHGAYRTSGRRLSRESARVTA